MGRRHWPRKIFIKLRMALETATWFGSKGVRTILRFVRRQREMQRIRRTARHPYNCQFANDALEEMHTRTDSIRTQAAIKAVMKQRGYTFNFEVERFVPSGTTDAGHNNKIHLLDNRRTRSYEEIEAQLKSQHKDQA